MARKSRKNIETAPKQAVCKTVHNAGAYVRLSAVDKKQKGDSIETQKAIIEAFIAECPDIELRESYIDNGLSGQSFERPAFQRMIADMESGKINCCVTKDLSRLGRNAIDAGFYLEKYFPRHGVRFIAITDGYDSAHGNGGGIIISMKNMMNEAYALEIGRKIHETKQMHIRNGCFVGRFPPYGYMKCSEDGHRLIPDEYAAPIVSRMFEMAASGAGVSAVLKWLNDSGILPPKRYLHSIGLASDKEAAGHIHWNKGVVYCILKNRAYCGDMVQGKYRTHSYDQKKLPQSDWVITENTHEGIVSREMFAEVQKLWDKPGKPLNRQYGDPSTQNIFLRKVFCGNCGHTMFRRRDSDTQYSFSCNTRHMYDKADCVPISISEKMLKEKVIAMLRKYKAAIHTGHDETQEIDSEKAALSGVRQEIERNRLYMESLYENLIIGVITDNEYRELKASYESKIALLTESETQIRGAVNDRIRRQAVRAKASANLRTVQKVPDITADVVESLIERIHVFENKSIKVKFTFSDEEIACGEVA